MGKKKVVLDQFDFIRAIACLGIVLFHFAVEYGWPDIFNNYVGGVTYGDIYVTIFFFISGALLFYNHSEVDDLKLFYKKIWHINNVSYNDFITYAYCNYY